MKPSLVFLYLGIREHHGIFRGIPASYLPVHYKFIICEYLTEILHHKARENVQNLYKIHSILKLARTELERTESFLSYRQDSFNIDF